MVGMFFLWCEIEDRDGVMRGGRHVTKKREMKKI
jgi:hypothetical protein